MSLNPIKPTLNSIESPCRPNLFPQVFIATQFGSADTLNLGGTSGGYPNSWMVYNGQSLEQMDDYLGNGWFISWKIPSMDDDLGVAL